jgi:hypothetical protein
VAELFSDEHGGAMKASTFKMLSRSTRMLSPDYAIDDWDVEVSGMVGPDGAPMPHPLGHHVTVVLHKQDGKWWVAAARPVVYQPAPAGMAKGH